MGNEFTEGERIKKKVFLIFFLKEVFFLRGDITRVCI